jgi:type I restriction enzyme S subunit
MTESVLREQRVLDWVGGFPERWETHSLGSQMYPVSQKNLGLKVKTVLSLSYGRVIVKPIEKLRGLVPESFETYQILEPGDIVIRPTDLQNDKTSLRVGLVQNHGIITSAYISIRTRESLDKRYAACLLGAYDFMKVFYGFGSGLRQNLDFRHLKHIPIPLPQRDEQALIVRYLDHAELRIAKAIQAKQKMVALLNEQKQVIISELVTRGLDPDVPMKDSGQAWLGQIPAHWGVVHLRSLITSRAGRNGGAEALLSVLRSRGVTPRDHDRKANHNVIPDDLSNYKQVRIGDLVVNKMKAWSGSVGVSEFDGIVSPAYFVYRLRFGNSKYWNLLLRGPGLKHEFARASKGVRVGQWDLDPFGLKSISIPVPPDIEQSAIADVVNVRISQIDAAISAVEREIDLLQEYRTVLISDVVTGKKDVRAEAANLPDVDPAQLAQVLSGVVSVDGEEDEVDGASEAE